MPPLAAPLLVLVPFWFAARFRRRADEEPSEPEVKLRTVASQRLNSGRRVARDPAVMPAPHSMPDHIAIIAAFPKASMVSSRARSLVDVLQESRRTEKVGWTD